ncbi:MAG: hypothetical protein A3H17_04155 [Candidatus Levybacteria bacterium RIFCSPLOWO2_12_FULL_37_14]|nr:MAG: Aspartyl/glutamyl-tRNA(Asn/Gln) amidotransferase subunit C [Candidatus Levybacteria bacterium GW2011_GWA1_37_16]KKQ42062.1 MAG: Aspartyl/glutamyl-tRNA(Asn/Gln) amidotransferase subunit C [Candidatus Levybacteria bacterium GW2011_GWB1_37_8]OGH50223.1 MAG: hypothetical protein A3H17_04155 [Candidatus Levybacteria bacterium RIFCSPLOWO2_12_FULL_37_14]
MKINVPHVAKLANLTLKPEEEKKFEKQLSDILTYVDKLKEVDTKNVETTSQVTGLENVMREDEPTPSLTQDEALSNVKNQHNGLFKVKAILTE